MATQQMKWTINIAICDDDRIETGIVEEMLRMVASEQGIKINCDVFFDGASLLEAIRDQGMCFELVYMDIMMKDMDGIHTAQVLREMSIPALIVYISAYEDYLIELFCTEPFRFLKKPLNFVKLSLMHMRGYVGQHIILPFLITGYYIRCLLTGLFTLKVMTELSPFIWKEKITAQCRIDFMAK